MLSKIRVCELIENIIELKENIKNKSMCIVQFFPLMHRRTDRRDNTTLIQSKITL